MSAILPRSVKFTELFEKLSLYGAKPVHRGKVRDTYDLGIPDCLLFVATDRISIFDRVLPFEIPKKGEVLTAMTHFWLTGPLREFPNHLVDDKRLYEELKKRFPFLPLQRCMLVKKLRIPPYELIYRHHIGGSVWREYQEKGTAAGQPLPSRLKKWQELAEPIFTPSTKADEGQHDENITVDRFLQETGEGGADAMNMGKEAFGKAYQFALGSGIRILDTKFEGFGTLADEVLTPDSSRFTTEEDYVLAMKEGRDPMFYDKQPVRDAGSVIDTPWGPGVKCLDPNDPEQMEWIENKLVGEFPFEIVEETTQRYLKIFKMLTGFSLNRYQRDFMNIELN